MKKLAKIAAYAGCIGLCVTGLTVAATGAAVPIKAKVAQVLLEKAYAKTVETGTPQRPWSWADMAPIGKITVPRLGCFGDHSERRIA